MRDTRLIKKFIQSSKVKNLGVSPENVLRILKYYDDTVFNELLENGHIELGNGIILEVVQLLDRVHVLRGIPYKSSRKYKLKLTMEDRVYKRIEEYYDRLQEEIK